MEKIFNLKFKKEYLVAIIVFVLLIIGFILVSFNDSSTSDTNDLVLEEKEEIKEEKVISKIKVDIKGEVKIPGVYELNKNSIVNDAIKVSGGLTVSADTSYINLSRKLKDEMVIIIYSKKEISDLKNGNSNIVTLEGKCNCPSVINDGCIKDTEKITNNKPSSKPTENVNAIININLATKVELETLTGIGPSRADDIILYRKNNGPFKTIEDLKSVKGIGEATFNKIKTRITV